MLKNELNFYWRMGDYALEAAPLYSPNQFSDDESNETIDLVKYYQYKGRECKYSIGYFWYNDRESCWELKFCGDYTLQFKELHKTDIMTMFEMLAAAYDTLEAWNRNKKDA